MASNPNILGIVLAGGEGRRLMPLTRDRAKPAVPFGGGFRLIDFALSNLANSGIRKMIVLTQYKSHSLDAHLAKTWRFSTLLGNYVTPVPAQQRAGKRWFEGSADAVWQNLNIIDDEKPDIICVFGADHIYRMDADQMVEAHLANGSGVTVAGIRVPRAEAFRFGVIETEPGSPRIRAFKEKPAEAQGLADDPERVFASMGNYVFDTGALVEAVSRDHEDPDSAHDMGGNIIADKVAEGDAAVYDFNSNVVPGSTERDHAYWRDVGTIDSYYDANMDMIAVDPVFNLYNREWPIYTYHEPLPPAKFVFEEEGRRGVATQSMVDAGTVVSGASVSRSVIGPSCRLHSYSRVEGSVLLGNNEIHRNALVRRAILDKNVVVPAGTSVGVDLDRDRERYHVTDSGIVVIGKNDPVHPD